MSGKDNLKKKSPAREWSSDIPSMLEETARCYMNFVAAYATEKHDAKSFRDYHTACRSALAHLEHLIKISNWAGAGEVPSTGADDNLDQLIARAQATLESHPVENEENT